MVSLNFQSFELTNQVTIQDIENQTMSTSNDGNSLLLKGKLYYYKIGDQSISDGKVMESWLNYVLYAGLIKFRFKRGRFRINLGLSLRDYYQNIGNYLGLKRQKKLSFIDGNKEVSKTLDIIAFNISPNIYAQALVCSKITKRKKLVVLKFGFDEFEGIYFNHDFSKEKQFYVLGNGLGDYFDSLNFNKPNKADATSEIRKEFDIESKIKKKLIHYFSSQVARKIASLISHGKNTPIIIIRDEEISEYIGKFIASLIGSTNKIFVITNPQNLASEGLYMLNDYDSYDSYNEKIGVSIGIEKTTFTSRKNKLLAS